MKEKLLIQLINLVIGMINPELLRRLADTFLDFIEDEVVESENKIDDMIVLPLCKVVRDAFDIEDNDDEQ
jgi:hypothetical protein